MESICSFCVDVKLLKQLPCYVLRDSATRVPNQFPLDKAWSGEGLKCNSDERFCTAGLPCIKILKHIKSLSLIMMPIIAPVTR